MNIEWNKPVTVVKSYKTKAHLIIMIIKSIKSEYEASSCPKK